MSYPEIQSALLGAIQDYFKYTIQRPELLNRIGDNIIVFDFIREEAAEQILQLKLRAVIRNLEREKGLHLVLSDDFQAHLRTLAKADLSNGGRGISNMVETQLVNPLAQILAQAACHAGNTLVIQGADPAAPGGLTYHIE